MADNTILQLPVVTALGGDEYFWLVQGGVDKRATTAQIATFPETGLSYVTANNEGSSLPDSRQLAVSGLLTLTDNGSASTLVIGLGGSVGTAQALSVIGNSTNALAIPGSIPGTSNQVLRVNSSGTSLEFGAINLASISAVSNILPVPNGGTGDSTFTVNGLVYGNGTGSLLVTSSAANSVLVTSVSNIPSLSQTLPLAVQANITTVGITTGTWQGNIIAVPYGGTGTGTITSNGIVYGSGTSSIGVTAAAANSILATNVSSAPSLVQTLPLAVQNNITTVGIVISGTWQGTSVKVPFGGTGTTTITTNGIVFGNGTGSIGVTSSAANSVLVTSVGSLPSLSQTLPLSVQQNITTVGVITGTWQGNIITVPFGGTGTSTLTSHGIVIGQGASPLRAAAVMSNGQLIVGQTGADPSPTTVVGDITLSSGGTATITNNAVTFAKFQQVTGLSIIGVTGTATANTAAITGVANQALVVNSGGTSLSFGAVNLASSAAVTGNLPVTNLNSGANATANTFWRGDGTWQTPSGAGTVSGPATSTNTALARWNGTAGTILLDSQITLTGTGTLSRTGGISIHGTNTNDTPPTGYVGEYVAGVVQSSAAIPLTSGAALNITSITLSPGDWDVNGIMNFNGAAATGVKYIIGSISTTSVSLDITAGHRNDIYYANTSTVTIFNNGNTPANVIPDIQYLVNSTTTIYMIALCEFAVSTMSAFGKLSARRAR